MAGKIFKTCRISKYRSGDDIMHDLERLYKKTQTIMIFRSLLEDKAVNRLCLLIRNLCSARESQSMLSLDSQAETLSLYSEFVLSLYESGRGDLSDHILELVLNDQNIYSREASQKREVPAYLEKCLSEELDTLSQLSLVSSDFLRQKSGYDGFLPEYSVTPHDFKELYLERISQIHQKGFGKFALHSTFMLEDDDLIPVQNPDVTSLSDLMGYRAQRKQVIENTKALLRGISSANILLYGDAGTGKSATVKALANDLFDEGLRLIEIKKSQYSRIPRLIDDLSTNPLKFILFIDDLSFSRDDDDFSSLKAILEGSVSSRSDNIVIYATSNRRHFVKESFSDRDGDDLHFSDTMEEISSLSDRFGLTITFSRPDKDEYLRIVSELAAKMQLDIAPEQLSVKAEAFAIRRSGRSPRVAKHFVELMSSGVIS